jgi:hypothetical protein
LTEREVQIQQFMNENCVLCGTQSCVCHLGMIDEQAISHCGHYHGEKKIDKVEFMFNSTHIFEI